MNLAPTLGTGVSSLPPEGAASALGRTGAGGLAHTLGTGVSPSAAEVLAPRCPLCTGDGGEVVFRAAQLRVIRADEVGFPAFYRVVWAAHAAEFSDLDAAERVVCMNAVVAVEQALRSILAPTKINVAALGNMVPHLHWHVIARFDWDSHFPAPVWASAVRDRAPRQEAQVVDRRAALEADIVRRLTALLTLPLDSTLESP